MPQPAVFLDRDGTLIEDSGYLADPAGVKLLPGAELAVKSLAGGGYKIVVVTNQSGVARGMFTEETLERIHDEMSRQLREKGAQIDAIYYCPYHPAAAVPEYSKDSSLRKPAPGMLLKAAKDFDIKLADSWMVGDDPRDVEAGQRAGCRTILIQHEDAPMAETEGVQPDATARNLVEAARTILHAPAPAEGDAGTGQEASPVFVSVSSAPEQPGSADPEEPPEPMDDSQVRREILRLVRQLVKTGQSPEFSATKLVGGVVQVFALLSLLLVFWKLLGMAPIEEAMVWALITVALQVMALTFFVMHQRR